LGFGSYQVGSGRASGHLVSDYFGFWIVSGHLVSDHFRFRVVSGRVGSDIGSSSVGSFRISDRIRSGRVGYRIVQCLGLFRIMDHIGSEWVGRISRIGSDYATSNIYMKKDCAYIMVKDLSWGIYLIYATNISALSFLTSDSSSLKSLMLSAVKWGKN
jgi:hypothetical protein